MRSAAWSETGYRLGHEFFSAHRIAGPVFGQVHSSSDETLESRRGKRQSDADDRILDFATVAVVLSFDSDGFLARFGRSGFVDHPDGPRVGLLAGDHLAASPEYFVVVPLDRFEESLERSRCDALLQSDRFDVLSL